MTAPPVSRKLRLDFDDNGEPLNVGDKVRIHDVFAIVGEENGEKILIGWPEGEIFDGIEKVSDAKA